MNYYQLVFQEKKNFRIYLKNKACLVLITFNIYPFNVNYDSKIIL